MKNIITILAAVILTANVFAQAPQLMTYQSVVRNGSGTLVTNTAVGIKISILQDSATGTPVYQEIFNPNPHTNANGLVSISVGGGIPVLGTFAAINWGAGPYYIETQTDPTGGTNYTIAGTSQLLSVPYALYAKSGGSTWTDYAEIAELDTAPTLNSGQHSYISNTRLLDTVVASAGSSITFNSVNHSIILAPGKYYVTASAPIFLQSYTNLTPSWTVNITSYLNFVGSVSNSIFSDFTDSPPGSWKTLFLSGIINVTSSETFLLNQYVNMNTTGNPTLTTAGGAAIPGVSHITYAKVLIQRIQ